MNLHKYAKKNNIKIHYIVSNSTNNNTPVVFIPGVLFEAQDNYDDINSFLNYKNIFIDIRGKGKSDIPESGYTLSDQISDIQSVCVKEKICNFFLVGQSLGSALACKYAIENPSIIKGIILLDYLPKYPIFSEKWLENNIQQKSKVSKTTLEGLKQDSEYQDLTKDLAKINIPILLLIGSKKNSIVSTEQAEIMKNEIPMLDYIVIENSGHDLYYDNPTMTAIEINKFIHEIIVKS